MHIMRIGWTKKMLTDVGGLVGGALVEGAGVVVACIGNTLNHDVCRRVVATGAVMERIEKRTGITVKVYPALVEPIR